MIIDSEQDITTAVLAEAGRTPDPRLRRILTLAVKHLHAFVREARLSELEFQQICRAVAATGQATNASHNEVVLAAGSLGVSALVCLLNNVPPGHEGPGTTANLMGPFWRMHSPPTPNGGSIVRSPTPGEPIFVEAFVVDAEGAPVAGAEVDVWHASPEGFYENQDPGQADMNLRGKFTSDDAGRIAFRSVKPVGYPVPVNGPVGALLRAQGRHNMRPAHLHFLITKPGFKAQFSQVYSADDPNIEDDVQFGVTRALVARYERHVPGGAAAAPAADVGGPWYTLKQRFVLQPGEPRLPPPPVVGKAGGERPTLVRLRRRG
ncbi:MAG: catechol 1,2-dioxygenase [Burkholderiales bacterium]|nr:catechol 1,2-dioxygenase [Burkholderiales bacterium]